MSRQDRLRQNGRQPAHEQTNASQPRQAGCRHHLLYFLYLGSNPQELWRQMANADKLLLLTGACLYASAVALNGVK